MPPNGGLPALVPESEVFQASNPDPETQELLKDGRSDNVFLQPVSWATDQFSLEETIAMKFGESNTVLPRFLKVSMETDEDNNSWDSSEMDDETLSSPENKQQHLGVGAGLENLGNTCFMNAILQCVTHTVLLVRAVRSCSHGCCQEFCVLCVLRQHIETALAARESTIAPAIFVANLKYISPNFERGNQEDAHEFLQCLLGRLEECCLRSRSKNMSPSHDDNIVEQIFGGSLKSRLTCCNCGHSSDTHERLIDLSLEIDNVDTLVTALESFTKVEKIEDPDQMVTCEGCKENVSVEKQLQLEKSPSVAAIHLKRFKAHGGRLQKLSKHVDFPLELDLQPYCIGCDDNNEALKYDLYAVVVHKGFTLASGHYYCYVRSSSDVWYKFDDWKVTVVQESSVLLEDVYILFYARQGTPWISDLVDVPKRFDPNNSITSPHSVLDDRDSTWTLYGSSLNFYGHGRPNHLFSAGTRAGEPEVDQTIPSEEGNSRQNGANVYGYISSTINGNSLYSGPSNHCSESIYNLRVLASLRGVNNFDIEAEDRNKIVHLKNPSTSLKEDSHRHVPDDRASCETTHNLPMDEEGVKRRRSENKVPDSSYITEVMRSAQKYMPATLKGSKLIAPIVETPWSIKQGKRVASSHGKEGSSGGLVDTFTGMSILPWQLPLYNRCPSKNI